MYEWHQLTVRGGFSLSIEASSTAVRRIEFGTRIEVNKSTSAVMHEAIRQLRLYFAGELQNFDLPLEMNGTEFQRRVWAALRTIPYGETRSYSDIARQIGAPQAVRAVGAANGRNPIPIVVPCHRVIGRDGSLTGFGGGLAWKRLLLDLEAKHAHRVREAAAR
ncbi:MAG TPA: methylated-DNA--[protein]-cysteine S-methyltransferase [Bryobacteraceae bacterium]|nr:methylated-DNA--[protein]-cysteine S-methyltransferase [Bryobacteraceae bacterium]